MKISIAWVFVAAVTAAPSSGAAQTIPVRSLRPALATSTQTLGAVLGVRELPGGRVLVSDARHHQLLLFDSTLTSATVVLDSTPGMPNSYGSGPAPVFAYLGDSSFFVDVSGHALLLIDPSGRVARVVAAPNPNDMPFMAVSAAHVDNRGRLVYRGLGVSTSGLAIGEGQFSTMNRSTNADSVPLLRGDFRTRTVDTLASLKNLNAQRSERNDTRGQFRLTVYVNPIPTGDEWAMLSDGTVAVVRGHDYHIDWISPDGTTSSTSGLPFDWKRLADDDKQRILDSAQAVRDSAHQAGVSSGTARPIPPGAAVINMTSVPLRELPDYMPPIRSGAAHGDSDNNLWILPATSAQSKAGELVYDVVNRRGELFERVRVPLGRVIVGFGSGGVVYLTSGDLTKGFHLERTRIADR